MFLRVVLNVAEGVSKQDEDIQESDGFGSEDVIKGK